MFLRWLLRLLTPLTVAPGHDLTVRSEDCRRCRQMIQAVNEKAGR